jgi:putative inorganic carbon (HCO3(-)) transporter
MAGVRLPRIVGSELVWALAAILLALGGGLLVGAAPELAFDLVVIGAAAVVVAKYPFPALVVILILRAALPNSVLIGFLTLGAGAAAVVVVAPRLPAKRVILPFLGLLVIALASTPLLPSPDEGIAPPPLTLPIVGFQYASAPSQELLAWMNLASVLAVFCLAAWSVTTLRRVQALVTVVLVSSVVPVVIALKQLATGDTVTRSGSSLQSLRGPFTFPNYFAFYLVVILLVAVVVLLESRSLAVRLSVSGLALALLVCLFLTYTRSAWVGFAVALLALALLRYRRLLLVAAVAALLAVLVAPGAAHQAQQRFGDLTSKSEANDSNSWKWRTDQWSALVHYGSDRALTGQGFGSYSRVTVRQFGHFNKRYPTVQQPGLGVYSPLGFTAHNDYVRMFVELGVPGVVLWVLVFGGVVLTAARARRVRGLEALAAGMFATTLALMLISVSDNLQGYSVVLMYAFALCGALAGATAAATRRRAAAPILEPVAVGASQADEPETDPVIEPELELAARPAPGPARPRHRGASSVRAQLRGWLRRRRP